MSVEHSPLGKNTPYHDNYNPNLLFPIARTQQRSRIQITTSLPFTGHDLWTGYELSWLNSKGKPVVAFAKFTFPCDSTNLIESKSFKLYLNSFNQTQFADTASVQAALQRDLSAATQSHVIVELFDFANPQFSHVRNFHGQSLDSLDITISEYDVNPDFLTLDNETIVEEVWYSDLLKSNCPITGQPDWGSIQIRYQGPKINAEGLLRYIVSFRQHNDFHEHCIERIFMDIMTRCRPQQLAVDARYIRRGGLDINPFRTTPGYAAATQHRLVRQ